MPPTKLVALALAAALAVGCSGGDDDDAADRTTTSKAPTVTVALDVGRAELVSPHQPLSPLGATVTKQVAGVVEQLLAVASAEPLVAGKAGAGFADLFTPDAGARAGGADREAFFDEGLPSFGSRLKTDIATVALTGLAGSDSPAPALVVADFAWDVGSTQPLGNRVVRTGELSLIPVDGDWRIAAYTVNVERTIGDTTTTTTAELEP